MGAVGEGGVQFVNESVVRAAGVSDTEFAVADAAARAQLEARSRKLRGERRAAELRDRTVVVVDDGIATGSTARVACAVARAAGAREVVLAVPVAAESTVAALRRDADIDEVVALLAPAHFLAVGQWYRDFAQTSDDEVSRLLRDA
jgi:putative phosphoribosyl transferase